MGKEQTKEQRSTESDREEERISLEGNYLGYFWKTAFPSSSRDGGNREGLFGSWLEEVEGGETEGGGGGGVNECMGRLKLKTVRYSEYRRALLSPKGRGREEEERGEGGSEDKITEGKTPRKRKERKENTETQKVCGRYVRI